MKNCIAPKSNFVLGIKGSNVYGQSDKIVIAYYGTALITKTKGTYNIIISVNNRFRHNIIFFTL